MASNPARCPPDTTSFWNGAGASSASGSSDSDGPPAEEQGHERNGVQSGRESIRIAPHRLQKADDQSSLWEILILQAAHLGHECPRRWMVLAQRECAWLQQRQRYIKTAGTREQKAETP
jgi:hypothetical protein